jgi:membrane protease YdiL (CAAX protease family)
MSTDQENPGLQDDEEDSSAGESARPISLVQARIIAMQAARYQYGDYGNFADFHMVFEVEYEYEADDHFAITLLYRPQRRFVGSPGREQFLIAKNGVTTHREVIDLPESEDQHPSPPDMQMSEDSKNRHISVPWTMSDMVIGTGLVIGSFVGFLLLLQPLIAAVDGGISALGIIWLAAASEGVLLYVVWRFAVKKYGVGWDVLGLRRTMNRRNVTLDRASFSAVWRLSIQRRGIGWDMQGFRRAKNRSNLIVNIALVAGTLLASLILTGIYAALVTKLDIKILIPEPVPEELTGGGVYYRLLIAIAISGWVPFVEELFFRGFLFQGLASRYGIIWGVLFSAIVFAVAHFMIATIIPIFIIGVMFAILYARTRSLWMPISAHAIQNLMALTLS